MTHTHFPVNGAIYTRGDPEIRGKVPLFPQF